MPARSPIIGGNWKSNPKSRAAIDDLAKAFCASDFDGAKVEVVIAATALHCMYAKEKLGGKFQVAMQNCSKEGEGAFTGEVTCGQILDMGLEWTLIGHSERRHKYGETDADLAAKVQKAQAAGLKIIFCIGELLEERKSGATIEVCKKQLLAVIPSISDWSKVVIAYEPVWAIGTGEVATVEQAQEAHAACRAIVAEAVSPEVASQVRIQYGGSVTPENCGSLIQCADVDGFLVGGASLKPSFVDIIKTVEKNTS